MTATLLTAPSASAGGMCDRARPRVCRHDGSHSVRTACGWFRDTRYQTVPDGGRNRADEGDNPLDDDSVRLLDRGASPGA